MRIWLMLEQLFVYLFFLSIKESGCRAFFNSNGWSLLLFLLKASSTLNCCFTKGDGLPMGREGSIQCNAFFCCSSKLFLLWVSLLRSCRTCLNTLWGRSNNVGVEEAAFESIAPIMGTCNVNDTLNSEDAVNTIMELFIKGHEGFVLEGGPLHLFVGIHNIHDNVYRAKHEVGAAPKKHNRDVLR